MKTIWIIADEYYFRQALKKYILEFHVNLCSWCQAPIFLSFLDTLTGIGNKIER